MEHASLCLNSDRFSMLSSVWKPIPTAPTMMSFIVFAFLVATATAFPRSSVRRVESTYGLQARIVNGDNAQRAEWPWQASLQYKSGGQWYHFCGGSLVDELWVVTAAHCVEGMGNNEVRVVLGEHRQSTTSGNEQAIYTDMMYYHGSYSSSTLVNDIAIVKLAAPVQLNQYAQLISMAGPNDSFNSNDECFISGWGQTSANGGAANVLQETEMEVITRSVCRQTWGNSIQDGMICIRHRTSDASACMGDSGGPLVCRQGTSWTLVGATSWGSGECMTHLPNVYSSIPYFNDWLVYVMENY